MATPALQVRAPQRIKMSYDDYLAFTPENQIVEWVNGEGIVYMPPVYEHQNVVIFLLELMGAFIRFFDLGKLVIAPFEVKLWPDGPSREPDLFFVAREHTKRLGEKRFEGAPDLVVEVLSPGSVAEDRVRKFTEYQQAGVREYWIVDPRPHQQQADFYLLGVDGEYYAAAVDQDGRYQSAVLPHFWLDVAWLAGEDLPNPQRLLAEIMLTVPGLSDEARETFRRLYELLGPAQSLP